MTTRFLLGLFGVALFVGACAGACTPAERAELAPIVAPVERASCVGLRASSGAFDDVCATADELAPFVSEILAARAASPEPSPPAVRAFSMPPPKRAAPQRRCSSARVDAGAPAEGGPP